MVKKYLLAVLAALIAAGLSLTTLGGSTSPFNANPATPDANDDLVELGPLSLVMATYNGSGQVTCNQGVGSGSSDDCGGQVSLASWPDFQGDVQTISCAAVTGISIVQEDNCKAQGNGFRLDHEMSALPCQNVHFLTVTITNSAMDTLILNISPSNNPSGCNFP